MDNAGLSAKARHVLEFAQQRAATASDWIELSNALFGIDGKATELFATEKERSDFCRTKEYQRILALLDTLPQPPVKGFVDATLLWNSQTRPACPPSPSKR
ncbi:MAG: hypothetical protein ACYC3I_09665 [Gemmataceae bacterium]